MPALKMGGGGNISFCPSGSSSRPMSGMKDPPLGRRPSISDNGVDGGRPYTQPKRSITDYQQLSTSELIYRPALTRPSGCVSTAILVWLEAPSVSRKPCLVGGPSLGRRSGLAGGPSARRSRLAGDPSVKGKSRLPGGPSVMSV